MKDELTTISRADLDAMDADRVAYLGLAVDLFNHCLQTDPDFKNDWLYSKAMEVLRTRNETSM